MAKRKKPATAPVRPTWRRLFIREWLDHKDRSQTWLAESTGYSEPFLSLVISGKRRYNQEILEAIGTVLEVPPAAFFHKPGSEELLDLYSGFTPDQQEQAIRLLKALKQPQ